MNEIYKEFGSDLAENQEHVRIVEKLISEAPDLIESKAREKGNWLEAFFSVLFSIETKVFDPRFEKGIGMPRCGKIRDRIENLRHKVDLLLNAEKGSNWEKSISEDKRKALLKKLSQVL